MASLSKPLLLLPLLFSCSCGVLATPNHEQPDTHQSDGGHVPVADDEGDDFFPDLIASDDIAYFFSSYDLDGLHWALTNVFARSARNLTRTGGPPLPPSVVARGGGDFYTTEYKLRHDLAQARYLAAELARSDPRTAGYFAAEVIPIYEEVLHGIPPLAELERTKGLYAFAPRDYALGIQRVYNRALFATDAAALDPGWRDSPLLNNGLDWEGIQKDYFGERKPKQSTAASGSASPPPENGSGTSHPGVVVIDDFLTPRALSTLRRLLLHNTHWFQTKTPLEFGKYVGAYIDDGLHDPIFLELAKQLHQSLPRVMEGHPLKYMWACECLMPVACRPSLAIRAGLLLITCCCFPVPDKYDSEFNSGINLHADQAAVNVNLWLSSEGADLEEDGHGGGLVVFTAKPPAHWDFEVRQRRWLFPPFAGDARAPDSRPRPVSRTTPTPTTWWRSCSGRTASPT